MTRVRGYVGNANYIIEVILMLFYQSEVDKYLLITNLNPYLLEGHFPAKE